MIVIIVFLMVVKPLLSGRASGDAFRWRPRSRAESAVRRPSSAQVSTSIPRHVEALRSGRQGRAVGPDRLDRRHASRDRGWRNDRRRWAVSDAITTSRRADGSRRRRGPSRPPRPSARRRRPRPAPATVVAPSTRPRTGPSPYHGRGRSSTPGDHPTCPTSPRRPPTCSTPSGRAAHLDGDRLVIDDEARFRSHGHPRPRLDRGLQHGRRHDRGRPVARLGGEPGPRRAVGEHPGAVQRARPRRGQRVHGPGHQHPRRRPSTWPARSSRPPRRRRRRGHPGARPQRADLHVPAADRLRDVGPRRRHRRGLAEPGLHPGRPLPVQRQEVRRRPRGDDRGDPARLPAGDRRRLPQHRHRLARRSSTCRSRPSTSSSARTTRAPPS